MARITFGGVLSDKRRELDMTQRELAAQIKREGTSISAAYLNDIEHDRRSPSPELLKQFARVLKIKEDYLVYLAGRFPEVRRLTEDQFAEGMTAFRQATGR
jgi:transcriptional regulator with XRE-family HTH domain